MYYGPQGNRLYSWLLTKKKYHWYVISVSSTIMLLGFWILLVYQPINGLIDLEIQKIVSAQEHCAQGIAAKHNCQKLEQELKEHAMMCDTACKASGNYLSCLVDQAKKAEIVLSSCSCDNGSSSECNGYTISCKLRGSFQHLLHFFDNIVQTGSYLGCNHLSLYVESDKQCDILCQFEYIV